MNFSRRDFLKLATFLTGSMGLSTGLTPHLAHALEKLSLGKTPVLWLQAQACSGCSVSFLNSDEPGPAELLTQYIHLLYNATISAATGDLVIELCNGAIERGGYFLVVEGALPAGMPEACLMGHQPMTTLIARAARQAKAIITVGSCASWGGVPAAENNPTGAVSAPDYLRSQGITDKPLIRLPGCPVHPDWIVGTLAHILGFGVPELDDLSRPKMFFGRTVHDQCPRFSDFERERFALRFGDPGCLFKLGCAGPRTHADCPERLWNSGTNFCIQASAPCTGCAAPDFMRLASFPLYGKPAQKPVQGHVQKERSSISSQALHKVSPLSPEKSGQERKL